MKIGYFKRAPHSIYIFNHSPKFKMACAVMKRSPGLWSLRAQPSTADLSVHRSSLERCPEPWVFLLLPN